MKLLLSAELPKDTSSLISLIEENGKIKKSILLASDAQLIPKFSAIEKKRAIGANEIINFFVSIPIGVATGILANSLYDWLKKAKIQQIRIVKTVVTVTDDKQKTITQIEKTIIEESKL